MLPTYYCPYCGTDFAAVDLQQAAGIRGGTYCPKCQERVRVSFPYSGRVAAVSVLLAFGALLVMKVRSVLWLCVATPALWIPISLFLNSYFARFKFPTLKKWEDRKHRTFFEWLYEWDQIRAPKTNDVDEKDS